MSGNILFETSKWRDIVELGLCMAIYDVGNDSQFENCIPLDFANFLNVREVSPLVCVYNLYVQFLGRGMGNFENRTFTALVIPERVCS